ncbi:hypothetical protein NC653_017425 [Populus alba x Populus x berolinensis]|uniref:Uncharacterized protein n=1 Tax=Populus alba x Populus x berolinensis TaxID=444605 RepID=A0AAD6QQE0_9ROSI|nr:hypothetical protein NC653_017425 [Populus alba x Populus x berolinensis]
MLLLCFLLEPWISCDEETKTCCCTICYCYLKEDAGLQLLTVEPVVSDEEYLPLLLTEFTVLLGAWLTVGEIPLVEVYLEAHRCTAEEEWLERWSSRWRRRKAHCYWVAGWMRESFSQWQGTTLATVVIEVLVNKRQRERELSGGIREAQPHKVVLMERVSQCWHRFNGGMGVVRRGCWWWCLEGVHNF